MVDMKEKATAGPPDTHGMASVQVTEGFSKIWDEVRKQKDELLVKLGAVGAKQEQMIESQAQMDERLRQASFLLAMRYDMIRCHGMCHSSVSDICCAK